MRDIGKFRGCLIGGAVGDALGYAVEFMSAPEVFKRYGAGGITEYELRHGVAEISDDTQMTLFTVTGLLLGTTRGMTRGVMGDYAFYVALSCRDWYRTQTESYPLPGEMHYSWLVNLPEMFSRRAPGATCLSALAGGGDGTVERPINNSKGCGGVMRVAPVGLYFCDNRMYDPEEVDLIGARCAALTHGHEMGYIPAAMLTHIIMRIAEHGDSVRQAVKDAVCMMPAIFPGAKHLDGLLALIQRAVELAGAEVGDPEAIGRLGEGWTGDEALAIAVYCALKYPDDFTKCVTAAVNHDGDSDSTGSIAGSILGASLGIDAIPEKFTDRLELRDVIMDIADDLHHDCRIGEYGPWDDVWASKYVSMTYGREA